MTEVHRRPVKVYLNQGRRELKELVQTCDAISERKFNPFFLDVGLAVETIRRFYPHWETFEDHLLDAHVLNKLSEVVRLQNTQLRFQSSTLYSDPDFLRQKFDLMSEKRLSEIFLKSWHPLLELQQITEAAITEAIEYWNALPPVKERWARLRLGQAAPAGGVDMQYLMQHGVVSPEEFEKATLRLWDELKMAAQSGKVDYWAFVRRGSFDETVNRAYHVSFLVTYGYAELEARNESLTLAPNPEQRRRPEHHNVSLPISLRQPVGAASQ